MSETHESKSFFMKHLEGYKEFWAERFSYLDNYSRFLHPEKPLPHWNNSVVEEFIASDPIHGPLLGLFAPLVSTAGYAWKWSRSPHGAALSFAFGAVVGATVGIEMANHWYQLYRLDPMAKFFEWLQNRA